MRQSQFPYVGPGAIPALEVIYEGQRGRMKYSGQTSEKWSKRLFEIHQSQDRYLPKDFPRLTLWDCQHCLCEWRKYLKLKDTGGKRGRRFTAKRREQEDLGKEIRDRMAKDAEEMNEKFPGIGIAPDIDSTEERKE